MKTALLMLGLMLMSLPVHAGWLDDISTVIGGHINDLQSRFADDQIIDGQTIARANFRENDRGQDTLHNGSGSVLVVEASDGRYLQLAPDFSSTPGPDYHVYVSQDVGIDHEDRFVKSRQIELGRLIKGSGASFYRLPDGIDFQSVTIWCKAFNEFIMSADFKNE